jgi:hypothetical protein
MSEEISWEQQALKQILQYLSEAQGRLQDGRRYSAQEVEDMLEVVKVVTITDKAGETHTGTLTPTPPGDGEYVYVVGRTSEIGPDPAR